MAKDSAKRIFAGLSNVPHNLKMHCSCTCRSLRDEEDTNLLRTEQAEVLQHQNRKTERGTVSYRRKPGSEGLQADNRVDLVPFCKKRTHEESLPQKSTAMRIPEQFTYSC